VSIPDNHDQICIKLHTLFERLLATEDMVDRGSFDEEDVVDSLNIDPLGISG